MCQGFVLLSNTVHEQAAQFEGWLRLSDIQFVLIAVHYGGMGQSAKYLSVQVL